MDEDLRSEIRQVIQQEIRRASTGAIPSSQSSSNSANELMNRTRTLINNSAASAVQQFNRIRPALSSTSRLTSVPNHPNRLSVSSGKSKKRKLEAKVYTHEIQILKPWKGSINADGTIPDYGLQNSFILLRQVLLDLRNDMKDQEIRDKIVSSCRARLPNLKPDSFEYVKMDKNRIYTPIFQEDFKFDYSQVKKLAGNGKIYIRLLNDIENSDTSDEEELPIAPGFSSSQALSDSPEQPCCSRSGSDSSILDSLKEIFPNVPESTLREYSSLTNLSEAVNLVADTIRGESLPSISSNRRHVLHVNEETILEDCFCYYKNSDFDPNTPLRIAFEGQSAIDAGGPTRQFFTLVAEKMIANFFVGTAGNFLPKIDANTILSEVFVVVGKVIAHSIVHGCSGLPFLCPAAYRYLCSGNISDATYYVKTEQVANEAYRHFIQEVCVFFLYSF